MKAISVTRVLAGNPAGGEFATKNNSESDVRLREPRIERQIWNDALEPGDVIIGALGGRLDVIGVRPSAHTRGMLEIDTEFGTLHLQGESSSLRAGDDESRFSALDLDEKSFRALFAQARSELDLTGVFYSKTDAHGRFDELVEDGVVSGDFEEIWPIIRNSDHWLSLSDGTEETWATVTDAVTESAE